MVITILSLPPSSTTAPLFSLLWYFSAELMSVLSIHGGHRYFELQSKGKKDVYFVEETVFFGLK